MRFRSLRVAVAVPLALAAMTLGAIGHLRGWLPSVEQDLVHARFAIRDAPPPRDLTLVAIDADTFARLDATAWPYPRSVHARVIDRLRRAGARLIVYDVQFTEATRPREDAALFDAVRRAGNVILATSEVADDGRTNVFGGDDNVAQARAEVGAANFAAAPGGVVERVDHSVGGLRTLAVVAAERLDRRRVDPAAFRGGAWIDFAGGPNAIPTISFADVLEGRFDPAALRGHVVVVGASVPTLHDVHATPTTGDQLMSGPEIQANAIATVRDGLPLRDAPTWLELLLVGVLAWGAPLAASRARILLVAGGGVLALPLLAVAAQVLFERGTVLSLTWPALTLGLSVGGTVVGGYVEANVHRRRVERENDELERRVRERTAELREAQLEVVRRLALAAEHRDTETGRHVERIGVMAGALARALGLPEPDAERIMQAAILHDVGKLAVPDAILRKPGPLTPEERAVMERHAETGAEMLAGSRSPLMREAEAIALTHHERWDGGGYPAGLAGERIPLGGRICAVCDVFDALVSQRVYKGPFPLHEALESLAAERGAHFDPRVLDAFLPIAPELHARLHAGAPAAERSPGWVADVHNSDVRPTRAGAITSAGR